MQYIYNNVPLLHHHYSNTDWIIRSVAIATTSFIGYSYTEGYSELALLYSVLTNYTIAS